MSALKRYRKEAKARRVKRAQRNRALLTALTASKDVLDGFDALSETWQADVLLDRDALTKIRDVLFAAVENAQITNKHMTPEPAHHAIVEILRERFGGDYVRDFETGAHVYERMTPVAERRNLDQDDADLRLVPKEQLIVNFNVEFWLGGMLDKGKAKMNFKLDAVLDITRDGEGKAKYSHVRAVAIENLSLHDVVTPSVLEDIYGDILIALEVPHAARLQLEYNWVPQY